jgi:hypothetical protein
MQIGAKAPFRAAIYSGSRACCPINSSTSYVELNRQAEKKRSLLRGRTIINCFFENSTTRTSFEVAGKRLGGDVINMSVSASSMVKGETLIDTAMTLNAMHPDVLVVRRPESGADACGRLVKTISGGYWAAAAATASGTRFGAGVSRTATAATIAASTPKPASA